MARSDLVILDVQDAPDFDALVRGLGDDKFARKVSQAAGRIASETRTDVSRRIREVWNIKKKDLDKGLTVSRSTLDGYPVVELRVKGSPINVRDFDAVGVRRVAGGVKVDRTSGSKLQKRAKLGSGINALIKKGDGRTNLPSAFFATVGAGRGTSTRVFRRDSNGGLKNVNVITIASMFDQLGIREPTIEQALKRFDEELKRITYLDI